MISMGKPKVLIADSSEEFSLALSGILQGNYHVRCVDEGHEALQLTRSFLPDILVLDLMLPGLDGITLLSQAAESGIHPMVLATTRYPSNYALESAARLGVCFVMVKPCDIQAVADHVCDISHMLKAPVLSSPDPRSLISGLLLRLGVSTKLRGYAYIREAVLLMAKDPRQSITKELYPAVGALCGSTAMQVERSARSAIHAAWQHRDVSTWQFYFIPDKTGGIPRPTNAAFISRLADLLVTDAIPSVE